MSTANVEEKIKNHFLRRYGIDFEKLKICSVPGYWEDTKTGSTYYYAEFSTKYSYCDETTIYYPPKDNKGRFQSPYRIWRYFLNKEESKTEIIWKG